MHMHYIHYMHYKDYIHHDFYVYSPVLLTQYLGHCWHTPCTELYILRISAWLLRKPPLPCHRGGGEPSGWGRGGCGGPCSYIYIYVLCYILSKGSAWPFSSRCRKSNECSNGDPQSSEPHEMAGR